jgi:hypothetical protein
VNNTDKIEKLKLKMGELKGFKTKLDSGCLGKFNLLRKEICELLDDNQKIKFNAIEFYTKSVVPFKADEDDLPF